MTSIEEVRTLEGFNTHPVIKRSFRIPTPPIIEVTRIAQAIISTGRPGYVFESPPRFGKSSAAQYLSDVLQTAYPNSFVVLFNAHAEKVNTSNRFYLDLINQSLVNRDAKIDHHSIRETLSRSWWALASQKSDHRIILIVDEGQRLTQDELTWLIDISNDLNKRAIGVTSLFFCQPQILSTRTLFVKTGRSDIVCRFLSTIKEFPGIRNVSELARVLEAYDDPTICSHPEGSGFCFTHFFLPKAYSNGWRLKQQAVHLWQAFETSAPLGLDSRGVGMEWVAASIQSILTSHFDNDCSQFQLSQNDWKCAVDDTGFTELQAILNS